MIDAKLASAQIDRLKCLDKWLTSEENKGIRAELLNILRMAQSDAIGISVMNEIIENHQKMPTPATLRKMIGDANADLQDRKHRCAACDGVGYKTIFQLITYVGPHSLSVKKKDDLPGIENWEQAKAFQEKILNQGVDNQIVLSAARRCGCAA